MKMFVIFIVLILQHLVDSEDICKSINCGSGICKTTKNPTLPYYCQCPNDSNTILPCPSENPCSRNPCGQGTCEVVPKLLYGYLCRCAGDTISLTSCNLIPNTCASNPCINGKCIEGLTSFICDCLPTWTGRTCNEKIDSSCSYNLCGIGKCFSIEDPSFPYVCLCPNGQFAISCSTMKSSSSTARMTRLTDSCNPLNSESCLNDGQCLPTMNGYQCLCVSGFTGRFCETKTNECASNPCLYGGVCYVLKSSYICACSDGSFRAQCLPKLKYLSTARTLVCPCQNDGVCSMTDPQMCTCLNGFTGKLCEIEYFQCQANGRFTDRYNCDKGKYFECIHHGQSGPNMNGVLLSRSCPETLRFNVLIDGCDYPKNVQCI